jgi:hypothetical protein
MAKDSADQPGAGDEELVCQTELISSLPVPVDPRPLPGDVTPP